MELISREELIKQIETDSKEHEEQYGDEWLFIDTIYSLPTVEERKEGKWIFKKKARHDDWSLFMCSECGRIIDATVRDFYLHAFDFCPRCGASNGWKGENR